MKIKCLLVVLLLGGSIALSVQTTAQAGCRCYCSDLCGPRDTKPDDTPFFDEEYGMCFCKERDRRNFIPHGCDRQSVQDFTSCCDSDE